MASASPARSEPTSTVTRPSTTATSGRASGRRGARPAKTPGAGAPPRPRVKPHLSPLGALTTAPGVVPAGGRQLTRRRRHRGVVRLPLSASAERLFGGLADGLTVAVHP